MPNALSVRGFLVAAAAAMAAWVAAAQEARAVDLSGSWSGSWQSCSTGHRGPLNATFCRLDAKHYQVTFRGRFFKIIPFTYTVVLTVVEESADSVTLAGSHYMGRRYGVFHYSATSNGCTFRADYTSCRDNGYFLLTRCCP